MPNQTDIEKLKARAAELRKIARQSHTKIGRHLAEQMAAEAERAATKAEADDAVKH